MLLLIPLLPFLGLPHQRLRSGGGCRRPCRAASPAPPIIASFGVSVAAVLDGGQHGTTPIEQTAFTWIASGDLQCRSRFRLDHLSSLMILVITGIGSLIHIYSTGYMHEEPDSGVRALLLVPEPVRVVHAGAGARRELPGHVRRLGRGRALLLPADRLLVSRRSRRPTPARRRSSSTASATSGSSSAMLLLFVTFGTLDFQAVVDRGRGRYAPETAGIGVHHGRHAAAVPRRHRQVGADPALRLAAGRDGRPDAGVGADPRRDDGDGRRLHDRPQRRAVLAWRR